jgi:predicted DNA-binding WGR domain protein
MDWESPPQNFRFVLFDRTDRSKNAHRFYWVGWQPTLFDERAVVRIYGRKGETQRTVTTPFDSLEQAWPLIRSVIKARLRHGYQIVAPSGLFNLLDTHQGHRSSAQVTAWRA